MTSEGSLVFYGYHPFSNFHYSPFVFNGRNFKTNEHFYQAQKARYFGDTKRYYQILEASTPAHAKYLGQHVKGFNEAKWLDVCEDVMIEGLREKFYRHEMMRKILIESYPKHLVEASPSDRYWGCGLHKSHPDAGDRSKYPGKNRLGHCLEEVRKSIMIGSEIPMEID